MSSSGYAAMKAWDHGRRRRSVAAVIERAADALMAIGGVLLVNAMFGLGMGFPDGMVGASMGGSLLLVGIVWISRHRAHQRLVRVVARAEVYTLRAPQALRRAA